MTRRAHPEDDLQIAVKEFLDVALPVDAVFHHSPNGGWRKKREAARFKRMGVKPGWPDCTIIWQGRAYFIELKIGSNTPSLTQIACHTALRIAKGKVEIAKSVEDVERLLRHVWGVPLQASVLPSGAVQRESA